MAGPLAGLKVLELARILAGPWAGQILADLGADVIKVERKGAGDDTRGWGPPFMPAADGGHLSASYYHAANRGKRSIELNFEEEEGRRIVKKLSDRSDVVLENFKVGGLAKFGLDYKSLSKDNPRLIYCSVTGFGQDGPYAERAGYDLLVQGMGGIMGVTGTAEGEPMRVGVPMVDLFTGTYAAVGILAALAERERTGKGKHVDVALLDTQVGILSNQAMSYLTTKEVPKRQGNTHPVVVPYQVFPVADGYIIIACGNDGQFAKLMQILGAPEFATDPQFKTNTDRVVNRGTLIPRMEDMTRRFKMAELIGQLEAVKVPAGPINLLDQVFADPQVKHRGMQVNYKNAAGKDGVIPGVRTPITIGGEHAAAERCAPRLGEHTAEVLSEIGEG